jgi:predicted Zn finger-like uncharacterized protein
MRVVCDNCGAVYKIANEKLTKEVNRATCKRCGHKIVIYKPGSRAAEEAAAALGGPEVDESDEERTVIKSVTELQKMTSSQASVPSIGSLTAELRAISIPGIGSVPSPAAKADSLGPLGPAGPSQGGLRPPPPAIAPLPGAGPMPSSPGMPSVMPATAIPPSESPATKVYDGPAPSLAAGPSSSSAADSTADATRPMPLPTTGSNQAPVPTNGSTGPTLGVGPGPAPVQSPSVGAPGHGHAAAPMGAATAVASVKVEAAPSSALVLGAVTWFSIVGLIGLLGSLAGLAFPLSLIFFALAALGLTSCLFLATFTGRGRHPQRILGALIAAVFLTVALTAVHGVVSGGIVSAPPEPRPAAFRPPPKQPSVAPAATPTTPADSGTTEPEGDGATGAGLDREELEMARKYSGVEVARLGSSPPEEAPTAKASKADVVRPAPTARRSDPTPRPRVVESTPAPRRETTLGPSRPRLNEPESATTSTRSDGPSPFVIDTIIRNNAAILRCLRVEEAKGVDLSGKLYLRFTIAPGGEVSKARVTTSRFAGTALDTCMSRELNSLKFPPFDGIPKKITYAMIVQ